MSKKNRTPKNTVLTPAEEARRSAVANLLADIGGTSTGRTSSRAPLRQSSLAVLKPTLQMLQDGELAKMLIHHKIVWYQGQRYWCLVPKILAHAVAKTFGRDIPLINIRPVTEYEIARIAALQGG